MSHDILYLICQCDVPTTYEVIRRKITEECSSFRIDCSSDNSGAQPKDNESGKTVCSSRRNSRIACSLVLLPGNPCFPPALFSYLVSVKKVRPSSYLGRLVDDYLDSYRTYYGTRARVGSGVLSHRPVHHRIHQSPVASTRTSTKLN